MDESQFLKKVLAVLAKQQTVLKKLAQSAPAMGGEDVAGNTTFLKRTWEIAAINSGFPGETPTVTHTPGSAGSDSSVTIEGNYTVTGPVPADKRELFNRQFHAQVKAQNPSLDGKVNVIYQDVARA